MGAMSAQPWEHRLARLEGSFEQIDRRLGDLTSHMDARFTQMVGSFGQVDGRLGQVDGRFGQMEGRIGALERKIDAVQWRLTALNRWNLGDDDANDSVPPLSP
jgi:hypothetical protein